MLTCTLFPPSDISCNSLQEQYNAKSFLLLMSSLILLSLESKQDEEDVVKQIFFNMQHLEHVEGALVRVRAN